MTTVYVGNTPYNFPDTMSADDIQAAMKNVAVDPNTGQPSKGPAGNPVTDFTYGLSRPYDVAGNYLARGIAAVAPEGSGVQQWAQRQAGPEGDLAKSAEAYKAAYGGNPPASSPQRTLGEAIPAAAASMAVPYSTGSFWPRLASNATGGAISGLLTGDPNTPGKNALEGGALGAAAAPITGVAARAAYPAMAQPGSDVRTLMDIGVRPTIGQASGGAINRIEQGLTSVPLIGDFVKSGRARSVYQFNMGLMNDALAPIGETLDAARPGREAFDEMATRISNAYQRAVPTAGGPVDQQAQAGLAQIRANASMLGTDREQQLNHMLDQYVTTHIDPTTGVMTGQGFQSADSNLGAQARNYMRSTLPADRDLGRQLLDAQGTLRDWLQRVSPQNAADLRAANAAWARMLRVQNAAERPGAEPGVFSPAQFQAAVKSFVPPGQVARGNALSQDLSDAGRTILGPTVPDSGTPFRHAVQIGGGLLAGHGMGLDIPMAAKVALGGAAAGTYGLYSPPGQALVAHLMASRYPWMQNLATGARGLSPIIAGTAPPSLLQ